MDAPARPTVILLGLPKAGTTTLHKCLVAAARPPICCAQAKEPNFFNNDWRNLTFEQLRMPSRWVAAAHAQQYGALFDFTPDYLGRAHIVLKRMRSTYGSGNGLHLLVALRDPVDRAFSEWCMFAKGPGHILLALRTERACNANMHRVGFKKGKSGISVSCDKPKRQGACSLEGCQDDLGMYRKNCTRAAPSYADSFSQTKCPRPTKGYLWDEFAQATSDILALIPEAAATNSMGQTVLNRTTLALALSQNNSKPLLSTITSLVLRERDPACSWDGWGWDYVNTGIQFEDVLRKQVAGFSKTKRCPLPPGEALTMDARRLEAYVRQCFPVWHYAYASQSVPTFQLAYFLANFPKATWTFVDYRRLYSNHSLDVLARLATRLGLQLQTSTSACDFLSQRKKRFVVDKVRPRFNRTRLDAIFAPWRQALMALVERSQLQGSELIY
mmetsp:Transcript_22056/g.47528  ORF Transcript_22056/g.47528 Transcript_22056/m.47528 type:complete len:443 (-) Transcript_22056:206-1534(-)